MVRFRQTKGRASNTCPPMDRIMPCTELWACYRLKEETSNIVFKVFNHRQNIRMTQTLSPSPMCSSSRLPDKQAGRPIDRLKPIWPHSSPFGLSWVGGGPGRWWGIDIGADPSFFLTEDFTVQHKKENRVDFSNTHTKWNTWTCMRKLHIIYVYILEGNMK